MIVPKNNSNKKTTMRDLLVSIGDLKPVESHYRTSSARQIGGAFNPRRVYGGQTVVQAYIAAKCYRPDSVPVLMDIIFHGAASVSKPIDYYAEINIPSSDHITIVSKQDDKVLNSANIRLAKTEKLDESTLKLSSVIFPSNIQPNCPKEEEMLAKMSVDAWIRENGLSYHLTLLTTNRQIFDKRIPDPVHYLAQSSETRPIMVWLRLKREFKDVKIGDKMIIPLLISDYVVGIPPIIAFDQQHIQVNMMTSMTHRVIFHSDDFDPFDYFFVLSNVENIKGVALMKGTIFSRNGLPILTYYQQSYFQLNNKNSSKL